MLSYNENLKEMQGDEPSDPGRTIPLDLELDYFDDEAIEYLKDYLADFKMDMTRKLINFLIGDNIRGTGEHQKQARINRIACRCVLLHKLLEMKDLKWSDIPEQYGISSHTFFEVKDEILKELKQFNPRIAKVLQMRAKCKHKSRRKNGPDLD